VLCEEGWSPSGFGFRGGACENACFSEGLQALPPGLAFKVGAPLRAHLIPKIDQNSCICCRVHRSCTGHVVGATDACKVGAPLASPSRSTSVSSGKCSHERLTRGTVTSTMRRAAHLSVCARCGAGAGCSAIKYQSLSLSLCLFGLTGLVKGGVLSAPRWTNLYREPSLST